MSDTFEFALRTQHLTVDEVRHADANVDVTSRLGYHEQITIEVDPRGDAQQSWFTIEPEDVSLESGETTSLTVSADIPVDAPPGDYDFALRAYAVSNPQRDFTVSQVLTASVPEQGESSGVKTWLLVLLAALALMLIGLAVWFVTRGSDELPMAGGAPDDVIAMPVDQAVAALDQDFMVDVFPDGSVEAGGGCVLLQTPGSDTEASDGTVALLTTECPTPHPLIKPPTSLFGLCQASFQFCQAVNRNYPEPPTNEAWSAASNAMAEQFVESFTIPGSMVPNVVGMPNIEARQVLLDAGFSFVEESDGGSGTACRSETNQNLGPPVLLQHPFDAVLAAEGAQVTLVLTSCPDDANQADDVVIDTTIAIDTFGNLRAAVPMYHQAVVDDPNLGRDFLESAEAIEIFTTMVKQLQQRFAIPRVPDIQGASVNSATSQVSAVGLELVVPPALMSPLPGFCINGVILTQSPAAGSLVADVADGKVNATADYEVGPCPFTIVRPEILQLEVVTGNLGELRADDE